MESIAAYLDRKHRVNDPSKVDLENLDLLMWGRRNRFVGLMVDDDVLVLDFKCFASCRIKKTNLGHIPYRIDCYQNTRQPFDTEYIKKYFDANEDNPYGIWNVVTASLSEEIPSELTQFPPLNYRKDTKSQCSAIEQMFNEARPADVVFTYDRKSGLSRLIRKYDRGMWSHVAMVSKSKRKTLLEVTTSGFLESNFDRLNEEGLDVGLYRLRETLTKEQVDRITGEMENMRGIEGYPWFALIRTYLQKRWRLRFRRGCIRVTPADLIYGNKFRLVCYA